MLQTESNENSLAEKENLISFKKTPNALQFCKNIKNIMKKDEQITEHIWTGEYLKSFRKQAKKYFNTIFPYS